MTPQPDYIDVGILYLALAGLALFLGVNVWRLLGIRDFKKALIAFGYFMRCVGVLVAFCGAVGVVVVLVAYAIGWTVHKLNWWPY